MISQQLSQETLGALTAVLTGGGHAGDNVDAVSDIVKMISRLKKDGTSSLTAYTAKSNVISRVYLDQAIAADDICIPLLGTLNQLYCCYVISALNLDSYVIGGRTVRDVIGSVASESFNLEPYQIVNAVFGESKAAVMETVAALEANGAMDLEKDSQRFIVGRMIEIRLSAGGMLTTTTTSTKDGTSFGTDERSDYVTDAVLHKDKHGNVYGKTITVPDPKKPRKTITKTVPEYVKRNGSGYTTDKYAARWETEEVPQSINIKEGGDFSKTTTTQKSEQIQEFTAYIYVQLIPRILTTDTSRLMLDIQYVPTLSERWRKYKAGEISFWKDFIFARDLINKQHQALKDDRTGTVGQIMTKSRGKLAQYFLGLAKFRDPSHNLASAITIISKDAFDRACKENNIDFSNIRMRNNYFNRTFTMMMVVVDTMYGKIDIYYNGVDYVGTYTFDMVNRVGAKGKDNFNLKEVMTAFSQGMSPRF